MLILTRRVGEAFVIGDDILVTVCAIHGNSVRVGVTAPRAVNVHREEVYARIQQEANPAAPLRRAAEAATESAEGAAGGGNSRFKAGKSPI